MSVEKNDVDISKLFTWGRVYEVVDSKGEVEALIYMKLLGDADVNRARVHALRKSADLRRKLQDPDSDERLMYIHDIDEMTKEDIANFIVIFTMRGIREQAFKEVTVAKPKQPKSNASLEKLEKYQQEVDAWPEKFSTAIQNYIQKEVEKTKKLLQSEDKEVLYKKYLDTLVKEFCEQEAIKAYSDMEIFLGCFRDDEYKERWFESFDDYDNLDSKIKADFRAAYNRISIGMDELKKLREATQ